MDQYSFTMQNVCADYLIVLVQRYRGGRTFSLPPYSHSPILAGPALIISLDQYMITPQAAQSITWNMYCIVQINKPIGSCNLTSHRHYTTCHYVTGLRSVTLHKCHRCSKAICCVRRIQGHSLTLVMTLVQ